MRRPRATPHATGVLLALWRGAAVFRIVALVVCAYLIIRWHDLYTRPGVAFGVGAAMVCSTAVIARRAMTGRAHLILLVGADAGLCIGLTLLTRLAQHPAQFHGDMPTLTTIWSAGPAIEAGLVLGSAGGVVAGLAQFAASVIVRDGYDGRTLANGVLLLIAGGIAGFLATFAVRAERERADIAAERARLAERDRLTRSIHDGVLQVLALVHRRAAAAGGEWADVAREAAAHEAALRALITREARPAAPTGTRDIAADLVALRSERVIVSVPGDPLLLDTAVVTELQSAVVEALRNVERHAGPEATAWVLVEQVDGAVVITVRDNGVGIPPGRLDEAVAEGRLGIAESIRGRVADLGGHLHVTSAPGEGAEVEISVPVGAVQDTAR